MIPALGEAHGWSWLPLALLFLHLPPLHFPLGVISARGSGFFCLCGPQRPDASTWVHPTFAPGWRASLCGRQSGQPAAAGCIIPRAAMAILPRFLAAGALPMPRSPVSCNTTCVADIGHFGLELGPVTLYPVGVSVLLVLRSLLSVRFQRHLEYFKNGVYFFSLHWSVYLWGFSYFLFSCPCLKFLLAIISFCDVSVLTNLTLCCKAVLHE